MVLHEARIHKYTHTNYKLSPLNIKYYNFGSSFDTIEFCSGRITCTCRSDTLDDTMATPCPKMPTSEAVNAYRVSQYGPTAESGPLTNSHPSTSSKGREELLTHS
jgi:hypothetical protein